MTRNVEVLVDNQLVRSHTNREMLLRRRFGDVVPTHLVMSDANRYGPKKPDPETSPFFRYRYAVTYEFNATIDGINVARTEEPLKRDIPPFSKLAAWRDFCAAMGTFRYNYAPLNLTRSYNSFAEHLGLPDRLTWNFNRAKTYAPLGPWEYLPPEAPFDWRVRAKCFLRPARPDQMLTLAAAAMSDYAGRIRIVGHD